MLTVLNERDPMPYHEQLSNILRAKIISGEIDYRVPSITTLAQEYGIARNTAVRAPGTLEDEGLIVTVQGRGTFVLDRK